jgi:phage/conjugal plasmid C-4 type zinc finger TraR family protein
MDEIDRVQAASEVYQEAALQFHRHKRAQEPQPEGNAGEKRKCIDCKETIPRARIEAKPNAVRCIGCQKKAELEEALDG